MTLKKFFLTLLFGAVFFTSSIAHAAPASEKSIRELMTLTGAGNMALQIMQNMIPALKQMAPPDIPESFWSEFAKEVDANELINGIVPIYQKHFTEEDVREAIRFYKSPTGAKFIAKQPQIMQESMAVGQRWGESIARRAMERIKNQEPKRQ